MGQAKEYLLFLASLLIAIIVLRFGLKALKKAPIVSGVAGKAEEMAFE